MFQGVGGYSVQSDAWTPASSAEGDWLRTLLDALGIGVLRVDNTNGTITYANGAMARIFGAPSAQAMEGMSVLSTYADPRERSEALARLLSHPDFLNRGIIRFEAKRLRVDTREPIDVLLSLRPILDADGHVVSIDGLVENLTDRRLADTAFRRGEQRFRALFETTAVGIAFTTPEGLVQRSNPALRHFLDVPPGRLDGSPLLDHAHPDDHEAARPVLTGRPPEHAHDVAPEAVELRFVRPDGSTIWGAVSVSWLQEHGGAHTRVVSVQDVTRRKRVEEALQTRQKLEAVGRLAGGIAHDFNNIVTVIQGNLALAADDPTIGTEAGELLKSAARSVRRAQDLAQQLITFSEGGCPVKRSLAVALLARDVGSVTLNGTNASLEVDASPDLPACEGDPAQLSQVFQHLFLNAVEAMPAGGPVHVRVAVERVVEGHRCGLAAGEYLRVEIEDHGVGIPEANLDHVFDPFFSTKRPGGGLGLPIVQSILRRHGGHAEIRSKVGQGTVVTLLVPAASAVAVETVRAQTDAMPLRKPRALVMDDDLDLLELERRVLTRGGFEVTCATTGEMAVEAFSKAQAEGKPYAGVVLDLTVVGGMGGLEALGRIRAIDATARAVVCSGYCRDPVMSDHAAHGFDGIVPKPFTPLQLLDEVRRVLDGSPHAP
jgi:PAS domain S-box-containing protein